jgi:DNA polymerase III delta prime subunit
MSELCQNTLLRFIEEPTDANRFVFTANDMSGILPTILSRVTAVPVMESEYKSGADILRDWGLNTDAIQTLQTLYQDKNHLYSSDARSIASNIASALASKNEYAVVTAFSAITTREKLNETLDCLLTLFRDALLISSGRRDDTVSPAAVSLSQAVSVKRLFLAASKIQQYIADSVYNPNVGLCTAAYSGELFSILTQ